MEHTMRTSIATALSVAGVVAAGAAAYAVNVSVLGAVADTPPAAMADAAMQTTTLPEIGVVTNAAVESQPNADTNTTTYKVGDAGSVVLNTADGKISVLSILPAAGFTSEPAQADSNGVIKVHFVSAQQRIEFIARLQNGSIVTNVVNETPPPATRPAEHNDDDDHDDDHDEKEHHDDHHHDEDDD